MAKFLDLIGTPRFQELLNKAAAIAREREVLWREVPKIQENMRGVFRLLKKEWDQKS